MGDIKIKTIKKSLPLGCYVFLALTWVLPIVLFPLIAYASEAFEAKDVVWAFTDPVLLGMLAFAFVFSILANFMFSKELEKWDGTEESTNRTNKLIKKLIWEGTPYWCMNCGFTFYLYTLFCSQ